MNDYLLKRLDRRFEAWVVRFRQLVAVQSEESLEVRANLVERYILLTDGALLLEALLHVGLGVHGLEGRVEVAQHKR